MDEQQNVNTVELLYSRKNDRRKSFYFSTIFLLFWIFVFKEIDCVEKRGILEQCTYFYTKKFVVTMCATKGFEKTLDLSLLFEAFSL